MQFFAFTFLFALQRANLKSNERQVRFMKLEAETISFPLATIPSDLFRVATKEYGQSD